MNNSDDEIFDALMFEARASDISVSDDLMARVMHDAAVLQNKAEDTALELAHASVWSQFMSVIGGWPALGGVAAAGVTGLWLGLAPTATLDGFAADIVGGTTSVSFIQDFDFMTEDGFDG